jgi:hypothetical protein
MLKILLKKKIVLFFGVSEAQGIHFLNIYLPFMQLILGDEPVTHEQEYILSIQYYQVYFIPGNTLFYPSCIRWDFAIPLSYPNSVIQWKGGGIDVSGDDLTV